MRDAKVRSTTGAAGRTTGDGTGGRARRQFGLLAAVQVIVNTSVTVTSVAGPAIQRDLSLARTDLVLVSAVYGIAFSGLLLLGGRLTERLGRRRQFRIGVDLFAAASLAAALAPGGGALIAARFVQGAGAALAAPAAMALLGAVFPDRDARDRATATWGALGGIGASFGILLSGSVAGLTSWRWSFVLLALVALAVRSATARTLPTGPAPVPVRIDVLGAVLVTAGLSALSYGLVMTGPHGWPSAAVLVPLAAAGALLAAFVITEARTRAPLLPLRFITPRRRAAALLTAMLGPATGASTAFLIALYFQQEQGYSALRTSAAFAPYSAVLLATGLLSGRLIGRYGARAVAVGGLVVMAAGMVLISGAYVTAGLLVLPVGIGTAVSAGVVSAVSAVPEPQAGLAGGVVNAAMLTGPTIGLAQMVSLADANGTGFAFGAAAGVLLLAGALVSYGLRAGAA